MKRRQRVGTTLSLFENILSQQRSELNKQREKWTVKPGLQNLTPWRNAFNTVSINNENLNYFQLKLCFRIQKVS